MIVREQTEGCNYWGYEPASAEGIHTPTDSATRKKRRELHDADRSAIKRANHKPMQMGFRTVEAARTAAELIEKVTTVEMAVFSHDYL